MTSYNMGMIQPCQVRIFLSEAILSLNVLFRRFRWHRKGKQAGAERTIHQVRLHDARNLCLPQRLLLAQRRVIVMRYRSSSHAESGPVVLIHPHVGMHMWEAVLCWIFSFSSGERPYAENNHPVTTDQGLWKASASARNLMLITWTEPQSQTPCGSSLLKMQ